MDRCVDRDDHVGVVVGWVLVEALVWPVPVEVRFVVAQHGVGVRLVVDQDLVGAFGSDAAYESFREGIRPRCLGWVFTTWMPSPANTASKVSVPS